MDFPDVTIHMASTASKRRGGRPKGASNRVLHDIDVITRIRYWIKEWPKDTQRLMLHLLLNEKFGHPQIDTYCKIVNLYLRCPAARSESVEAFLRQEYLK